MGVIKHLLRAGTSLVTSSTPPTLGVMIIVLNKASGETWGWGMLPSEVRFAEVQFGHFS